MLSPLPSISNAHLPAAYSQARAALAKCWKVDECKDWADKMQALASYARQARDEGLYKVALRIQARAIRRCGMLLGKIEANKGGRPTKTRAAADPSLRTQNRRVECNGRWLLCACP